MLKNEAKPSWPQQSDQPPERTLVEDCCLGIDEAGRGPVLGPMVYGCCYFPISEKEKLKGLGVDDSKKLSEWERERIFGKLLTANVGFATTIISPEELSTKMLRMVKYNLNAISHDTAIGLIEKVSRLGVKITEVYVDTVGDPTKYRIMLSKRFPSLSITVSKKADSLFPIVSAASICAKVIRDEQLKNWQFKERNATFSRKFGSGYPSDPATKQWLKQNFDTTFGFPSVIRFSWKTCTELLDKHAYPVQWLHEQEEEEQNRRSKKRKLSSSFELVPKPVPSSRPTDRYVYFRDRNLKRAVDF